MKNTVLITGAAKGIGRAIAYEFAKQEYQICIHYHTSFDLAKKLQEELQEQGVSCMIYGADISSRKEVDNMIDSVLSTFGSLDVVVNNAGICEYKLFTDITEQDLNEMLDVTVAGTFHVTQSALKKYMLHQKSGSIINISSIWGMVGASCEVNYSTSKAAIIGMTKALAKELGLSNIRVNAVTPGVIQTDMNQKLTEEECEALKEEIPLSRFGSPEEVATVVRFLASDEASYITGQVISPNGGMVI